MSKNIVNKDTYFNKRVVKLTNQTFSSVCGNDKDGDFANKTGDSRINFKVADGIDLQDAVSLKQLNEVKDLAFDYVSDKEPLNAKQGDIWLDISKSNGCIIKVRVLTPKGAVWVSGLDIVNKDLSNKISKLEEKVIAVFNDSDGRYALRNGSTSSRFNVSDAKDKTEAVNLKQLTETKNVLSDRLNNLDKAKINKEATLNKEEILALIKPLVPKDSLVGPFNIIGKLTNEELQALLEPTNGDIYYITDENTWAVRLQDEWFKDNALINNDKYFTKQQVLDLVGIKANTDDLEILNNEIEEIKKQINKLHSNEGNKRSGISIVTTEGGSVFSKALKYAETVVIDVDSDKKTLVDKEYVDNLFNGVLPPEIPPEIPPEKPIIPSNDNTYTKEEIDKLLQDYALKKDTLTLEEIDKKFEEFFRNRNDMNWKGYKASLQEIVSTMQVEVGDIYGVISLNNYPDVYMFDGDKWIALSSKGESNVYIGSSIKVIDNPVLSVSDDLNIAIRMCVIPIEIGYDLQVIGVYKEDKGKLVSIPFVTSLNNDKNTANIYTNSDTIDRVVYAEGNGRELDVELPKDNLFELDKDNTVKGNTNFEGNVIVKTPIENNQATNKEYVDGEILKVKELIKTANFEIVEVNDLVLEDSGGSDKGSKMFKIPLLPNVYISVSDAFKENNLNNSLDRVNIDTIIKENNLIVYTDSDIKKLVYVKYGTNK